MDLACVALCTNTKGKKTQRNFVNPGLCVTPFQDFEVCSVFLFFWFILPSHLSLSTTACLLMQSWILCICPLFSYSHQWMCCFTGAHYNARTHTHARTTSHLQFSLAGKTQRGAHNAYHYLTITLWDGTAWLFMAFLIYFSQAPKCWSALKLPFVALLKVDLL